MNHAQGMPSRMLVAVGGNAIHPEGIVGTPQEQVDIVAATAKALLPLMQLDNELIVTHGNGPQVGNLLLQQESCDVVPKLPLEILVAQITTADGGTSGVFMNNAGPVAITASALQASGAGTLTFNAASITIVDLGAAPVSLFPGRSLVLKSETGSIVFLNARDTTGFDDNIELQAGVTDPDYLKPLTFQTPRSVRAFARWSF